MMGIPAAIVTGAGGGIGRAVALKLALAGYGVALVGRTADKLRQTAGHIHGPHAVVPANLMDAPSCAASVRAAVEKFGRIDALCNVAGLALQARIESATDAHWRSILDTNLSAPFFLTRECWPIFARQNSGVIVNVSSMASVDPFPGFAAYASAKAALNMLTRVTACEGQRIGLRAVTIAPGAVETPMLRGIFDEKFIPPSAALDAEAVAELIRDCVTGRRPFISGQVILIDKESGIRELGDQSRSPGV